MSLHVFDRGLDWAALARKHGAPLLVLDCDVLRQQYRALAAALPGVAIHYAIKALPELAAIATLADEGARFDIASQGEIELLRSAGVSPLRTIHTHPIKRPRDIVAALRYGCTTFVVDNAHEIDKLARYRDRVGLLLRVSFRSPDARCDLSKKFGCPPEAVEGLLAHARARGIVVKGLCFHVGSQSASPDMHVSAIEACNEIIRAHNAAHDEKLYVLDIGGGFPVNYDGNTPPIDVFCAPIRDALAKLPGNVTVFAEPGRFLAAPAMTCIASVIGKADRGGKQWYFLDDGVYNSFSGMIFDHTTYPITTLVQASAAKPARPSVLAGPTCDSIDIIAEDIALPELEVGDLIVAPMMGAYTSASATEFNGFAKTTVLAIGAPAAKARQLRLV
jgi:ornithine decarboxylase